MTEEELKKILELHKKWLNNEESGVRADLRGVNLSSTDLRSADLRYVDLSSANLSWTNLSSVDLRWANLSSANLSSATLSSANLSWTNLSSANLRSANLRLANLHSANLSLADLRSANLRSVIGEMKSIKSFQLEKYNISYTDSMLYIGCESYPIEEWKNIDNDQISSMDSDALLWWTKWKPVIFQIIEMSPAEPTGYIDKK